jgi:uncharacterized sporulation protein YeaH/YhbH (DUF444 family)
LFDSTGSPEDQPSPGIEEEHSEDEKGENDEQDRQQEGQGEQVAAVAQADLDSLDLFYDDYALPEAQKQQLSEAAVSKATPSVKINTPEVNESTGESKDKERASERSDAKRFTQTWLSSTVLFVTFHSLLHWV